MSVTSTAHPAHSTAEEPFPDAPGQAQSQARTAELQGAPPQPYPYPYAYVYNPPGKIGSFFQRVGQKLPMWLAPAGIAVCVAGGVGYTVLMDPTASDADAQPTCIMKLLTGFDCPGCGGTRAAWYLLHGDIAAASRHHAMLVFATPFLIYMYLAWTLQIVTKRKILPQLQLSNVVIGGFIAAWMIFSVLRNLPWAPFTWMYV
jgi:hypothetical protein